MTQVLACFVPKMDGGIGSDTMSELKSDLLVGPEDGNIFPLSQYYLIPSDPQCMASVATAI